jgi:hypothetical protein
MTNLILKIVFKNIALFVILMTFATYVIFAQGYASNDGYDKEILIIYVIAAMLQTGINFLIYKKYIKSNPKIFLIVIVTIICIYLLYPWFNSII